MKKFLAILLTLVMVCSFAACGNEEAAPAPETLTDPSVTISENLPQFEMKGTYTASDLDRSIDSERLWTYIGTEDSQYGFVSAYTWDASGLSLEEEAYADSEKVYPGQPIKVHMSDYDYEGSKVEQAYYMAYNSEFSMYIQNWFLQDGDKIYQVEATINMSEVEIEGTNAVFALPNYYHAVDHSDNSIAAYDTDSIAFPELWIYTLPLETEFTAEALKNEWPVDELTVEELTYLNNGGNAPVRYYMTCTYEKDGNNRMEHDYVVKLDDCYLGFAFKYDVDNPTNAYTEMAESAIFYSGYSK